MANRRDFLKTAALAGAGLALLKGNEFLTWASPSPTLRKFLAALPGLGPTGIPVANALQHPSYPGADFYNLAAVQHRQRMHPDLPHDTTLWGYVDQTTGNSRYLGPAIVAQRNRPVVIRMTNQLPPVHPLPIDTTLMGADMGAAANRITVHLHGALVPWTSDGGPFTWFTPSSTGPNKGAGETFLNGVPGLRGTADYYYPNDQSSRLLWYHDHALGITRLNAYAGVAAPYLITDPVEQDLIKSNILPGIGIPLVIQDKSFKARADRYGIAGDLAYPTIYDAELSPNPSLPLPSVSCVPEFFGDTMLVNGMAYPFLEVEPRRYRFRILNGSQARFMNLMLFYESATTPGEADLKKGGPAFIQVGNETGFIPAPWVTNSPPVQTTLDPSDPTGETAIPTAPFNLLLGPAERADIIIDFSRVPVGSRLVLHTDVPAPFPGGDPANDVESAGGVGPETRDILQFRVVPLTGARDPYDFKETLAILKKILPEAYAVSQPGDLLNTAEGRRALRHPVGKTLNEDFDEYGRLIQREGTTAQNGNNLQGVPTWGRNYMDDATEVVSDGEVQVWDVYNLTMDAHPIHFHLVNVQVVGRAPFDAGDVGATPPVLPDFEATGKFRPPAANEMGWKETVRMNPGEVTRVIMKFDLPKVPFKVPPSPRTGGHEYVWHCHILEHEEHDMMRPLIVK